MFQVPAGTKHYHRILQTLTPPVTPKYMYILSGAIIKNELHVHITILEFSAAYIYLNTCPV